MPRAFLKKCTSAEILKKEDLTDIVRVLYNTH